MNFSRFRETGDLSDLTVNVDGNTFKLHKFPLYTKSGYFNNLARGNISDTQKVELTNFPGGQDIFSLVADFCYSMNYDLTKNNIVQVRCAAEYLQMNGEANLIEISEKFLQDTITSAKMSRSSAGIVTLLLYCATVGTLAERAGIVDQCIEALVDCWLKLPTRFSSPTSKKPSEEKSEKASNNLYTLPVEWFVKILTQGKEKGVKLSELGEMAIRYVTIAIEKDEADDTKSKSDSKGKIQDKDDSTKTSTISSKSTDKSVVKVDISKVLDAILMVLPEEAYAVSEVTTEWITKVLRVATARVCSCREVLVKIAGEMLNKLSPEDLCIISPSVLHDIVLESTRGDGDHAENACKLVDTYMSEMARKGVLTAETFKLLASAAPSSGRVTHDKMYEVLEYILKTEKDKLGKEQKRELLEQVNFNLLSEGTLQQAFDSDIVPQSLVARGALALCHKLRSELDSVKYIAQMQEEELQKYQARAATSPLAPANASRNSDSGFSDSRESLKASPDTTDAVKAAQDVLSAARSKLSGPIYSSHRVSHLPYNAPASSYSASTGVEHDISLDDELEFKFDRSFRSLDQRANQRRPTYNPSSSHTKHRTYFPYSHRY
ncbi:BTB/POZ domain-containing protein At5g48800-like [Haliotis rubra]|uniref:BTB/POZ domain-containing protein At5g48800-like n=1 Tax=Haliotis rubra TaxID=36100 RepID=UPI001EE593FB|nr:BTB/POZ domain-containing protein At5g48800-like [Haliotis rubra]